MKRKASRQLESPTPLKLTKQSTSEIINKKLSSLKRQDTQKKNIEPLKLSVQPSRSSSIRERKAPSWLSSYVTNNVQGKEKKKTDVPKPKMPRFPTLIPPSKRSKEALKTVKEENDESSASVTSLRRQSTLKVTSSPADLKVNDKKTFVKTPSLTRKATKLLNSTNNLAPISESDSRTNGSCKNDSSNSSPVQPKHKLVTKRVRLATIKSSDSKPPPLSSKPSKRSSLSRIASNRVTYKDKTVEENSKEAKSCGNPPDESDVTPPLKEEAAFPFNSVPKVTSINNTAASAWASNKVAEQTMLLKPSTLNNATATASALNRAAEQTMILSEPATPNMLEVVICISTSGALRNYLSALQDHIREMIWKLQSLVPNIRIGVMAHTQGGIHDDPTRGSFKAGDHNYNRTGGHSGTKWLDLGATLSQICAFVDSLESESTFYPDYVQDNLEMALWKLQRCMSWSSCSYRSVVLIGRGRPNRTTFYLQKEHWRGWIRSALELAQNMEIPVIDWELEAKLMAQMGIHVFTIQAVSNGGPGEGQEDEGTCFFRRVAEITQAQHAQISDPSRLPDILVGMCCACHGSELLSNHRDSVRDENDGILPTQLTNIFVGLQLHSKRNSLCSLPSMLRNLDLTSMRQNLSGFSSRKVELMDAKSTTIESSMEYENLRSESVMELENDGKDDKMEVSVCCGKTIPRAKSVKKNCALVKGNRKEVNGYKMKQKTEARSKPYNAVKRNKEVKSTVSSNRCDRAQQKSTVVAPINGQRQGKSPINRQRQDKSSINGQRQGKSPINRQRQDKSSINGQRQGKSPINRQRQDKSSINGQRQGKSPINRQRQDKSSINGKRQGKSPINGQQQRKSPINGQRFGKRAIKMTEKVRENLSVGKVGMVVKAKDRRSVSSSALKKEKVKDALSKAKQEVCRRKASNSQLVKKKIAKAGKIIQSKQSQKRSSSSSSSSDKKTNGDLTGRGARPAGVAQNARRYNNVSPLKRNASVGKPQRQSSLTTLKGKR